jgi:K+-transporting ATPase ATPase B chain
LSSLADDTPEGKSIVELWNWSGKQNLSEGATLIKFTAETRTSGVVLKDGTDIRKGAQDAAKILHWKRNNFPEDCTSSDCYLIKRWNAIGGRKKMLKFKGLNCRTLSNGNEERFERLRKWCKTVMVTGDNPLTRQIYCRSGWCRWFYCRSQTWG